MIGERQVIAHRMAGAVIRDSVLHAYTDDLKPNPDWRQYGEHPEIAIEAGDYPELLDLRFAVGLTVHVEGKDAGRVDAVSKAFEVAGAARVMGTVFSNGPWPAVTRLTDTQGMIVWPE